MGFDSCSLGVCYAMRQSIPLLWEEIWTKYCIVLAIKSDIAVD